MKKGIAGLSASAVLKSREKHGDNSLSKEKTKGILRRFFENLNDPIIKVLIIAVFIELVFTLGRCNLFEIFGIVAAILIATVVSTVSEYGSEKAFQKMQTDALKSRARVLRDGVISEIDVRDIVVGDIVYVSRGEKIAADGFVIDGCIEVDQSALNGESRAVTKRAGQGALELSDNSAVFRGGIIVNGEAIMRVARVGSNTFYGMVARDVQTETRESPLKHRLSHFASQISKIGYIMAIIVGVSYLFNTFVADNGFVGSKIVASFKDIPFLFSTLIHAMTLMITVVVVAAPEGLPMMITVVLSANMKKMIRDGVLVKKLVGIETAGSMNILFTDKTGTLTTGKLECDTFITVDGSYKTVAALKKKEIVFTNIGINAIYNSDAEIGANGEIIGGNGTERALADFFKNERGIKADIVKKLSFSSEKKYSAITLADGRIYVKGAPELIISRCTLMLDSSGAMLEFSKKAIEDEYLKAARCGNRVVALAMKYPEKGEFVFLALAVLKDKIRRGVRHSVDGVKKAGVQIVMLTGDSKETATAIAKECGIMRSEKSGIVLTSYELSLMSDDEVKNILPHLCVLARALPQDKTRLVRLSQELDLVVGMTGDGINDAPSLKLADVGFAMGNGADIAKSAGDIILVDNSFFSINRTILYGRTIFKSIRKFITFQLIMNMTACGVSLVGQFMGIDSPITIIQMLWVNIIMDTLGGLAFAGEAPLEYYMNEKPKKRGEAILSPGMLNQILFTGAYTLVMCIVFLSTDIFRTSFGLFDEKHFMTAFYALFIFAGIFNCFSSRCERMWIFSNISKNKLFVIIMSLISVIQILMIYYGGSIFRTVPISQRTVVYTVLLASSVVPFEFIRRLFYKLRRRSGA